MSTTIRRYDPHPLPAEEPGIEGAASSLRNRDQDDAFCDAMLEAVRSGQERATLGVSRTPANDAHSVGRVSATTFVPTCSSLDFV